MCMFKKKKLYKTYKLVWQYATTSPDSYTELVKAYDPAHAWEIVKRGHGIPISLVSVEEAR